MNSVAKKEIPCLITTLNRYNHFVQCVESLRINTRANEIKLVIALDYPLYEAHWDGYKKICKYLEQDFAEFHSVEIIKRNVNFGPSRNRREARDYLFKTYDRYICSEDDNVFSPNFFDYVLKGLEIYNDCETVFAVCGYSYPICWEKDNNSIAMSPTLFSAWGYGMWRERYQKYNAEYDENYILELARDKRRLANLRKKSKTLFFYLISDIGEKRIHKGDTGISIYIADKGYQCVLPQKSLVRNMGFDGSGLHWDRKAKYNYSEQIIDENFNFDYKSTDCTFKTNNMKQLDCFSNLGIKKNTRAIMEYTLFKLVGFPRYKKIKTLAKRIIRGNR